MSMRFLTTAAAIGLLLAVPSAVSGAAADGPPQSLNSAVGYGEHARPWAKDLLKAAPQPAGAANAPAAEERRRAQPPAAQDPIALALCLKGDETWHSRLLALRAAESAVSTQVTKLEALKVALERLLDEQQKVEAADLARLVNLYRNMKPAIAASILADLDAATVVPILMTMSERDAGPILANMPKEAAQRVTREIARRKSLEQIAKDIT